jgi:transposase
MTGRKPYRSDLSDAEWAQIGPELTAWREPRLARKVSANQPLHDLREIVNAILYVNRTGCAWEYVPHDFPPFKTVYGYFATWRDDGTTERIHDLLRRRLRRARGRTEEPTAVAVDSQTVKAAAYAEVDKVVEHGADLGIDVEVVRRDPTQPGFKVLPRRWIVERTFGWFILHRRLTRDDETRQESSRAMIHWSIIGIMNRALTGTSTPSWRETTHTTI